MRRSDLMHPLLFTVQTCSIVNPAPFTSSITSLAVMPSPTTVRGLFLSVVSTDHSLIPSALFNTGVILATHPLQLICLLYTSPSPRDCS
mgnify:CR=1 FL=1